MPKTVDEYLGAQPPAARKVLKRMRAIIKKTLGRGAEEVISYGIPAYRLHEHIVVFFAGFKEHVAMYPITRPLEQLLKQKVGKKQLSGRGTVRFPLDEKLPEKLVALVAKFRAGEVEAKYAKPKKKKK